jgi:RNA polymerase sigma factor (sigma-70 family)
MARIQLPRTDPKLLRRVAALWDNLAWCEFFRHYDPLVSGWCRAYGFDAASTDELRQRVWVELARRMPSFQYDPARSFRGWLRCLCRHRAIDLYHEQRDGFLSALRDDDLMDDRWSASDNGDDDAQDDGPPLERLLLAEAAEAQAEVRRQVKPIRWQIFWQVVIEGESMNDTAAALGLKYPTVYAAVNHVANLLRQQGRCRAARLGLDVTKSVRKQG